MGGRVGGGNNMVDAMGSSHIPLQLIVLTHRPCLCPKDAKERVRVGQREGKSEWVSE